MPATGTTSRADRALVVVSIGVLSLLTVWFQKEHLTLKYLENEQAQRHAAVIDARAPSPYQYRVFAEIVAEGFLEGARRLGLRRPEVKAFLFLRVLQQVLIFSVAVACFRSLGLTLRERLLGIAFLGAGMAHTVHNSDLSFNSYFELLFYLLAAWAVSAGRDPWIIPLSFAAALNRETAGLLPLLVLWPLATNPGGWRQHRRRMAIALGGLLAFGAVFIGLRVYFGLRPGDWANPWGLENVAANLSDTRTVALLAATMNVLPLITLWRLRRLPAILRGFFWILVPVWFAVHAYIARLKETRYFLVPLAVVFIPAVLVTLGDERD
jgi:hypothetical protein